jgi:hypothetical protein
MIPPEVHDFLENDKVHYLIEFVKVGGKVFVIKTMLSSMIPLFGFSAGGVVKGSIAALIHSLIGSVGKGTLFSILQSIGVSGGGCPVTIVSVIVFGPKIVDSTIR